MILVVGSGRSGTTAASRTLQERLGVNMGGPGRKHPSNPTGDYENREIRNKANAPFLRNEITEEEWRSRLIDLTEDLDEPWGYKDPRNAHFLEKTLDIFPDAYVIWAQRDIGDTVKSWTKWYNNATEKTATEEIMTRLNSIEYALRHRDYLPVDFTDHVDEEELAWNFYYWLTMKGQPGLQKPVGVS